MVMYSGDWRKMISISPSSIQSISTPTDATEEEARISLQGSTQPIWKSGQKFKNIANKAER